MPTPYSDVAHLLRRAGFGGLPNEISALAQYDLPEVVDRILDVSAAPPVVMPPVIADSSADWNTRYNAFTYLWLDRMATTPSPLAEKMTLFWHGHFTSSLDKTDFVNMWDQIQIFRTMGLGSFRDLAQAVAISPAMLLWLDNWLNVANGPNENFARELMELFTMGIGNYTEADVKAAARAWSGHGLVNNSRPYQFSAFKHDSGPKTFLGVTKEWNGPDIIDEIVLGSKRLVTARYIAKKIWTYFAYPNPADSLLDDLAASFIGSDMSISALLRAMFMRPEFYSDLARYNHMRDPSEYFVAVMRYSGVRCADLHPEWYVEKMGQKLLYPPNVAGWKTGAAWVYTQGMWKHMHLANDAAYLMKKAGVLSDSKSLSVATLVQRTFDLLGIDRPSLATRSAIESTITEDRVAKGWSEIPIALTMGMSCPEFLMG